MKILGIDISLTSCGISVIDDDYLNTKNIYTKSIIIDTKGISKLSYFEKEEEKNKRLLLIENEIIKIGKDVDYAVIENYAFDAKFNREKLAELHGILKRRLYLMGIPYLLVDTYKLKKVLTSYSKNPTSDNIKKWVLRETLKRYNIDFKNNDDECEAFGLSLIGLFYFDRELLKTNKLSLEIMTDIKDVINRIDNQHKPIILKNLIYYYNLNYNIVVYYDNLEYVSKIPFLNIEAREKTISKSLNALKKIKNSHIRELRKNKKRITLKKSEIGRISFLKKIK